MATGTAVLLRSRLILLVLFLLLVIVVTPIKYIFSQFGRKLAMTATIL